MHARRGKRHNRYSTTGSCLLDPCHSYAHKDCKGYTLYSIAFNLTAKVTL